MAGHGVGRVVQILRRVFAAGRARENVLYGGFRVANVLRRLGFGDLILLPCLHVVGIGRLRGLSFDFGLGRGLVFPILQIRLGQLPHQVGFVLIGQAAFGVGRDRDGFGLRRFEG